jgi:hypothetical protein
MSEKLISKNENRIYCRCSDDYVCAICEAIIAVGKKKSGE